MAKYDCLKCPGYCCSYPLIEITKTDVKRLAKHFGLNFSKARKKFTFVDPEAKYAMRRKADPHFGRICQFFVPEERRCTIYTARPSTCHEVACCKSLTRWTHGAGASAGRVVMHAVNAAQQVKNTMSLRMN